VCLRLFCVCVVPCVGSGVAMSWSLVQWVLPSVWKRSRNWRRGQRPTNRCRAIDGWMDERMNEWDFSSWPRRGKSHTERDLVIEKDVEGSRPIFFSRNSCTEIARSKGALLGESSVLTPRNCCLRRCKTKKDWLTYSRYTIPLQP
jgi:hypothetical protein